MKKKLSIIGLAILPLGILAIQIFPFSGWDSLKENSPDIVVARCLRTPTEVAEDRVIYTGMDIVSVLKSVTDWQHDHLEPASVGAAQLQSQFWPRQNEYYLIFSIHFSGKYQANEEYRVVPLGLYFQTNWIAGKTLDEQIRFLLERRLDNLKRQINDEQDEKQRLELGLKR